jgi:energy-converting hydrogenase Eha subunit B
VEEIIGGLIAAVLMIVPLWRICGRAGFSPALSLLVVIPWLGFLIIAAILGFAEWPSLKNGSSA